jgi:hypothetical protein
MHVGEVSHSRQHYPMSESAGRLRKVCVPKPGKASGGGQLNPIPSKR